MDGTQSKRRTKGKSGKRGCLSQKEPSDGASYLYHFLRRCILSYMLCN